MTRRHGLQPERTVIVGLGNSILSDDGAGIEAARRLREATRSSAEVVVAEVGAGGLHLLETIAGFDRAIVIDAMVTGTCPAGSVRRFELDDLPSTRNAACSHDLGFDTACELGRLLGLEVPETIVLFGVEAADTSSFGEQLTDAVATGVGRAVTAVMEAIGTEPAVVSEAPRT